ncbi:hypothetical protein ABEF95_013122 [Exophiala dermatitidis]
MKYSITVLALGATAVFAQQTTVSGVPSHAAASSSPSDCPAYCQRDAAANVGCSVGDLAGCYCTDEFAKAEESCYSSDACTTRISELYSTRSSLCGTVTGTTGAATATGAVSTSPAATSAAATSAAGHSGHGGSATSAAAGDSTSAAGHSGYGGSATSAAAGDSTSAAGHSGHGGSATSAAASGSSSAASAPAAYTGGAGANEVYVGGAAAVALLGAIVAL